MITFNVQAHNGNYYRGHEPSNRHENCWGESEDALVFTIEQARKIVRKIVVTWPGYLNIVISISAEPISDEQFRHELFCAKGGHWYDYKYDYKKEEKPRPKCGDCDDFKLVSKCGGKPTLNCALVGYGTKADNNPCDRFKRKKK